MKGKIHSIILLSAGLFLTAGLWAEDFSPSGIQTGPYVEYNQGLGAVTEHEIGNIAVGADVYYQLPLDYPENFPLFLGVSATVDFATSVGKKDYVDYWNVWHALGGIWFDWNLIEGLKLRPEVSYGVALNFVESEERNVHGLQLDQIIKVGVNLIWEPDYMRGFSIYGGTDYKFMPEKDNLGNFIGFKAGVLYRPENTYRKQKAAEKSVKKTEASEEVNEVVNVEE